MYIFSSLGFYTLAKRRGIRAPGLAWIPIGGTQWILGSLSDQYASLTGAKLRCSRHILLWGELVLTAAAIPLLVFAIQLLTATLAGQDVTMQLMQLNGVQTLLNLASIALSVMIYIALYKVYKSCDPKHAVLFLVLSIIFNITLPFFVFACRNKDLGMPQPDGGEEEPLPLY
ncbi:MAG: hypothetical protein DBY06_01630 [Clostridiales bacterium]|nr:MAG: hypothetical protein DBY06_01630 [Clostridiales bacterium]